MGIIYELPKGKKEKEIAKIEVEKRKLRENETNLKENPNIKEIKETVPNYRGVEIFEKNDKEVFL